MSKEGRSRGEKLPFKDLQTTHAKEKTLEQRKRAAYSAMGRLGGLARAKQMAEEGFTMNKELKSSPKKRSKNKKVKNKY